MERLGLPALVLLMSVLTAAAGHGHDLTAPDRMVQAFRDYCIYTEPTRLLAVPPSVPGKWDLSMSRWDDGKIVKIDEVLTLSLTEHSDPHRRLWLKILRTNGVPRACTIDAVWPDKSEIVRALAANVVLEAALTEDVEGDYEVIRWRTHARGASAIIELRVPIYAAKPGRSLTLALAR